MYMIRKTVLPEYVHLYIQANNIDAPGKSIGRALQRLLLSLAVLFVITTPSLNAEVTRLPFFPVTPFFSSRPEPFSHLSGWLLLDQSLNQKEYPDTGHCYELGNIFTFFSSPKFSVSGLAREMFQFRASPDSDMEFWTRALVTDLRLSAWYNAGTVKIGAGYRHDCKHDFESLVRTVIHDALFVQFLVPRFPLPIAQDSFRPETGFSIEAERNISPIFQKGESEPDAGRLSAECEFIPVSLFTDSLYLFVDGQCSCIYRKTDTRIPDDAWNIDGLIRTGINYHTGAGDIRLFYYYERITDNWASLTPETEHLSAVGIMIASNF